jgi:predicted alpha/beta-fold hydrolase
MSGQKLIDSLMLPSFVPLPFITSGMAQTLMSVLWPNFPDTRPDAIHEVELSDGDRLALVENRPASWQPGDRIALLVHGLVGHHQANYMIRAAQKLAQQGVLALRVNLRGCGIGFGKAKNPYHSGRSEDLRAVLQWTAEKFPNSPVTQIGYSLGANITLKMAGEDGAAAIHATASARRPSIVRASAFSLRPNVSDSINSPILTSPSSNLDSIIAISPPIDLAATARHLQKSQFKIFDQFFVWKLKWDIGRLHRRYPELPSFKFPLKMVLSDLDEIYTAPRCGFKNAQDYYSQSSSGPLISSIRVPALILCAEDDPIVDASAYAKFKFPPHVELVMTKTGGHVGFIGRTDQRNDVQWMDRLICQWIARLPRRASKLKAPKVPKVQLSRVPKVKKVTPVTEEC